MKKVRVDGLLALTPEQIKIIYLRCKGETIPKIAQRLHTSEATINNSRMPEIRRLLETNLWSEIKEDLCEPLRLMVQDLRSLDNWPEGYREKIEALKEPIETRSELEEPTSEAVEKIEDEGEPVEPPEIPQPEEPPPIEPTPEPQPYIPPPPASRPIWVLIAVPILVVCLLCAAGILLAWNTIEPRLFPDETTVAQREGTRTAELLQTPEAIQEAVETEPVVEATQSVQEEEIILPTTTPTSPPQPPEFTSTPEEAPIVVPQTPIEATSIPEVLETDFPSESDLIFSDNFDEGRADEWVVLEGNPLVLNDGNNGYLTCQGKAWLVLDIPTPENVLVTFESETPQNLQANTLGLRFQNLSEMVAFRWGAVEAFWFTVEDGRYIRVPGTDFNPGRGNIPFKVFVEGNKFGMYEGKSFTVDEGYESGKIALQILHEVKIDNFKVYRIP